MSAELPKAMVAFRVERGAVGFLVMVFQRYLMMGVEALILDFCFISRVSDT